MRPIINLLKNATEVSTTVLDLCRGNSKYLPIQRGEEQYTVKFPFPDGNAVIDIDLTPKCYMFHVMAENSILLTSKPSIPSFTVGLALEKVKGSRPEQLRFYKTPSDKQAMAWLLKKSQGPSNADTLMVIATVGEIIWSNFLFAFESHVIGDTYELVPQKNFKEVAKEGVDNIIKEYKRKHRFDGWDVVNLTQNQLQKLGETLESNHMQHDFENIAIRKFCLSLFQKFEDRSFFQYYYFTYTNGKMHVDVEEDRTKGTIYCDIICKKRSDGQLDISLDDNTNGMEWLTKTTKELEGVAYWQWLVDVFFSINTFMLNFGDVTMDVEEKIAKGPSEHREQRKHDHKNTVRIFKSYTLKKNWKSQARKKAEITCPAWGVRGHFRHLRNGKVLFIEPYIKGPEKDKYKGKEYALLPYKDA